MYGESNVNRITEWDEDLKKVEVEKQTATDGI